MEPPICEVTDEPFDPATGRRVRFVATPEGRAHDQRVATEGIAGDSPDEGWFSAPWAEAAERLAPNHTLAAAVELLRDEAASAGRSPSMPDDLRAELAHLEATRVDHDLGAALPAGVVRDTFGDIVDSIVLHLGLADLEPVEQSERSRAASPEPRDAIGTTTTRTRIGWTSPSHHVDITDEVIRWDSWSGTPGAGDLLQGTLSIKVDDTFLYGSYGSDGLVDRLTESGDRTSTVGPLLDELIERLRSAGERGG